MKAVLTKSDWLYKLGRSVESKDFSLTGIPSFRASSGFIISENALPRDDSASEVTDAHLPRLKYSLFYPTDVSIRQLI